MQVLSLTARAQEELTKPKDTPERMAWNGGAAGEAVEYLS
jgi:hypothetical protein